MDIYHKGYRIVVDDEDFPLLKKVTWRVVHMGDWSYLSSSLGFFHRVIMKAPTGTRVDHINGDSLDNRKVNLRLCTHSENLANTGAQCNNTSGYKGVSYDNRRGGWRGYINKYGVRYERQGFLTAEDAAKWRDDLARKLYGNFSRYNFPKEGERGI